MKFKIEYNFDPETEIELINRLNLPIEQKARQLEILDLFVNGKYDQCYHAMNDLPHGDTLEELHFVSPFIVQFLLDRIEPGKIEKFEIEK